MNAQPMTGFAPILRMGNVSSGMPLRNVMHFLELKMTTDTRWIKIPARPGAV
jgi:hypothetical protein